MTGPVTFDENERPYLDGKALLPGDLVEAELIEGAWFIGQLEAIKGEYQVSLFGSDWGRLVLHPGLQPVNFRRLADRPTTLPNFGDDFPPREETSEDDEGLPWGDDE